ncbi:MAG: carboxymuconolactone decarboxylase family protein [Acidimicrobiales bacterium]|nr:carboxymuconolactone decarboxylase family protein [Acidimicrobiales bacterium]MDG1876554.1 carboxymuconolactone decarboxylase family protein [Acidimicrobiales bacterium]
MTEFDGADPRVTRGQSVRRAVLGDDYVTSVSAPQTEARAALQALVAGAAWGTVWARDDKLSRRDRSLINVALLAALNRPHELGLHISGALNNGLSPAEIEEALLHIGPYAGLPAAIDGFRVAGPILDEHEGGQHASEA